MSTEVIEPPDGAAIVSLLAERWPIQDDETLKVDVDPDEQRLSLSLDSPRHRYNLILTLRGHPQGAEPWTILVDALDALFGQLIESGRDHRALPAGADVEFQGAVLNVEVEHIVPELEKLADQILAKNDE